MFDQPTMTAEECSPWPPALLFTPEVPAHHRAAANLAFGPGWDLDPADCDLDDVAADMLANAPDLAQFLMTLETA